MKFEDPDVADVPLPRNRLVRARCEPSARLVGALLLWRPAGVLVVVSVAAMRRVAREDRKAKRQPARMLRQLRDAKEAGAAETDIIVARDEVVLYDHFRRDQPGDQAVRIIRDRRSTVRRLRMKARIPDRRHGERRRYDIAPLLLTQGWAQVPKS